MELQDAEVIEADDIAVDGALSDLLTAVDIAVDEYGEAAAVMAVAALFLIHQDTYGLTIEQDRSKLN